MRAVVVRVVLGIGVFAASFVGASLLVDWLGAGERAVVLPPGNRGDLTPVAVLEPVAGNDDPADAGDGPSSVASAGYTANGSSPTAAGPGRARPPVELESPADVVDLFTADDRGSVGRHFEDPCAGPAPGEPPEEGAGCVEGEPGTVLAVVEPPPAEVLPVLFVMDHRGAPCTRGPVDEGRLALAIASSTPGDWALEWWPEDTPDDRRRIEVSGSDPTDPEHRRFLDWFETWDGASVRPADTWVAHCVVIDGLERRPGGGPRRYLLRAEGTDIYGRFAEGANRYELDDLRGRPPVRVQTLDTTQVRVSVPHRGDQRVWARATPLEPGEDGAAACRRVEALGLGSDEFDAAWTRGFRRSHQGFDRGRGESTVIESRWELPRPTTADASYPYDPAYRHVYEAGLVVDEGSRNALCVWWQRRGATSFEGTRVEEREVRLLTAPDTPRVRVSLSELHLERSLNARDLTVIASSAGGSEALLCGSTHPAEPQRLGARVRLDPQEPICDSGPDTGAIPGSLDVLVRHDPSGGRTTARIPLDACGLPASPSGAPRVGVEGATVRVGCKGPGTTELYRVVVPASRDDTICGGSVFSPCEFDRVGTVTIRVDYYDEGPPGGADFVVGDPESIEVEPEPPEPPPAEPRFDTWSTSAYATGEPGTIAVEYRLDRPVSGEVRVMPDPVHAVPCATDPVVTTPLPDNADRGTVTISGLCSLEWYAVAIDVVDADGDLASWSLPAVQTNGTRLNVWADVQIDRLPGDWNNLAVRNRLRLSFVNHAYPFSIRWEPTDEPCIRHGGRFRGTGSGSSADPVTLSFAITLSKSGEPTGCAASRGPVVELDHVEEVTLDELLAGTKEIVLETSTTGTGAPLGVPGVRVIVRIQTAVA